jgi:hypothetical protein
MLFYFKVANKLFYNEIIKKLIKQHYCIIVKHTHFKPIINWNKV